MGGEKNERGERKGGERSATTTKTSMSIQSRVLYTQSHLRGRKMGRNGKFDKTTPSVGKKKTAD